MGPGAGIKIGMRALYVQDSPAILNPEVSKPSLLKHAQCQSVAKPQTLCTHPLRHQMHLSGSELPRSYKSFSWNYTRYD
jgi:hypothetical protein